jgi:hypothetical protein
VLFTSRDCDVKIIVICNAFGKLFYKERKSGESPAQSRCRIRGVQHRMPLEPSALGRRAPDDDP